MLASARTRLADAGRGDLAFDSRFDLAYNAAHALALFALRRLGYRSRPRYLVFQCLPHTAGLPVESWRVLAKAHERRNLAEYEGQSLHGVLLRQPRGGGSVSHGYAYIRATTSQGRATFRGIRPISPSIATIETIGEEGVGGPDHQYT